MKHFKNLLNDESGATAIEYGLIAAILSVAIIVTLQSVSGSLIGTYGRVDTGLQTGN